MCLVHQNQSAITSNGLTLQYFWSSTCRSLKCASLMLTLDDQQGDTEGVNFWTTTDEWAGHEVGVQLICWFSRWVRRTTRILLREFLRKGVLHCLIGVKCYWLQGHLPPPKFLKAIVKAFLLIIGTFQFLATYYQCPPPFSIPADVYYHRPEIQEKFVVIGINSQLTETIISLRTIDWKNTAEQHNSIGEFIFSLLV